MHTAATAEELLNLLWSNYQTLSGEVDLEKMLPETLDVYIKRNAPVRPLRIAAWFARQGYVTSAWALWEYFSSCFCRDLANKEDRSNESIVDWVGRSLTANSMSFTEQAWFSNANCLRNLIAHHGARAIGSRAEALLARSRLAFPNMQTWSDGYLAIEHEHVAELQFKIEEFIRDRGEAAP